MKYYFHSVLLFHPYMGGGYALFHSVRLLLLHISDGQALRHFVLLYLHVGDGI